MCYHSGMFASAYWLDANRLRIAIFIFAKFLCFVYTFWIDIFCQNNINIPSSVANTEKT